MYALNWWGIQMHVVTLVCMPSNDLPLTNNAVWQNTSWEGNCSVPAATAISVVLYRDKTTKAY